MADSAFEIRGGEDLDRISRRLKEAGDGDLRKRMLRGIRDSAKPVIPKIRANALRELPGSGGLAARVAAETISVRTRATGANAGVSITRKRGRGLNAGRLRHPVFGNPEVWVQQEVPEGWFEEPIEESASTIRRDVEQVLTDVANDIARGL